MVDPEIIAIAALFVRRHGRVAAQRLRRLAEDHERERSEDARFWSAVADVAEGIRSSS